MQLLRDAYDIFMKITGRK